MNIERSCKCGKTTLTITEKPVIELCCHCNDCRASTGQPFANIAFFKVGTLEVKGSVSAAQFVADSGNKTRRESCAHCHVTLFDKSEGFPSLIGLMVDHVDYPFEFTPSCHVWTSRKLDEVEIPSGVKLYDKGIVRF